MELLLKSILGVWCLYVKLDSLDSALMHYESIHMIVWIVREKKTDYVLNLCSTVCTKSILTLGKEAIILGCEIIKGKCLISIEASGDSPHFNT